VTARPASDRPDPADLPNRDELAPGTIIDGRWLVVRKLGEGGMGSVYEARNQATRHRVAIKILSSEGAQHPAAVQRFRREAQVVAEIGDERFCQTYDFGQWQGRYYLVMQLLHGRTLTDYASDKQRSIAEVVGLVISACHALQVAHEKGVVHRDLKPDNLFVGDGGALVILDLGIAKMRSDSAFRTNTHAVVGTPSTMSPEQCLGADIDHRSDIYSLCTVLYKLLSGRYPFDGLPGEILVNHVRDDVPDLVALVPSLPPALAAIVHQNLAKKPEDRLQSMHALATALEPFARGPIAHVAQTPTLTNSATPALHGQLEPRHPSTRRRFLWVVPALLICGSWLAYQLRPRTAVQPAMVQRPSEAPQPRGRLFVSVVPADAVVRVDSKPWTGGSPVLLDGVVGERHRLEVAARGYLARNETYELGSGDQQLRLALVDEPSAPALGSLVVNAEPWAYVSIDGGKASETPLTLKLSAGSHKVVASNPALKQQKEAVVMVKPHQKKMLSFDLRVP